MKKHIYILFVIIVFFAKQNFVLGEDSLKVLSYKDFYTIILNNHPVVKQALLLNEMSFKELRIARGSFDPKFDFDYTRKVFKGTTYYDYIDNGLKVPLWFGGNIKSGFENNSGIYVNPANYTPPEGLWYLGLEIPIGQGMIMDERRAVVKTAKIATQISDAERVKLINKILLNASKDYWEWYYQFHKMKQLEMGYQLGKVRYESIRERIFQGDLAGIDSIEAEIAVQERWLMWQSATNDFNNTELYLSNYLWTEKEEPLQIDGLLPEVFIGNALPTDSVFKALMDFAEGNHPEVLKMDLKINQLKIDQKLSLNNLLPGFSVGLKYLNTPKANFNNDLDLNYISNNYKAVIGLSQPLFLRKERGKYQLSKLKVAYAKYDQKLVNRDILNEIGVAFNDVVTYNDLLRYQKGVLDNVRKLFEGEKSKFENGESTLFLINSRETKMIDSKIKWYELQAKREKSIAYLYWTAGTYNH